MWTHCSSPKSAVYSGFLGFPLMSFFCARIPFRQPDDMQSSCVLRLLWAVAVPRRDWFSMTLTGLWGADQLFCRKPLSWDLSEGFLRILWGVGLGQKESRGELPFLSHHIRGARRPHDHWSLSMLTLTTGQRSCLSAFSPAK